VCHVCLAVHLRTKKHASQEPAQLDVMGALASSVNIPVIANGDIYTCADLRSVMNFSPRGAAGAMLGRPLLLNPSLLCHLRLRDTIHNCTSSEQSKVDLESSCLPIRTVVQDFLHECIRYEPPFQIIKYTIQEMNSQRRHRQEKLVSSLHRIYM
jgi:tRNA-dihydrouridine synthase